MSPINIYALIYYSNWQLSSLQLWTGGNVFPLAKIRWDITIAVCILWFVYHVEIMSCVSCVNRTVCVNVYLTIFILHRNISYPCLKSIKKKKQSWFIWSLSYPWFWREHVYNSSVCINRQNGQHRTNSFILKSQDTFWQIRFGRKWGFN